MGEYISTGLSCAIVLALLFAIAFLEFGVALLFSIVFCWLFSIAFTPMCTLVIWGIFIVISFIISLT